MISEQEFSVGIVIRYSAHRPNPTANAAEPTAAIPDDFYRQKLKEALGEGVEALRDPEIEKAVESYFRENPTFSRDAVHVAAIACRMKKEKVVADRAAEAISQREASSPRLRI